MGRGILCFKGFGRRRAGWEGGLLALRFIWPGGCSEEGGLGVVGGNDTNWYNMGWVGEWCLGMGSYDFGDARGS